MKALEILKQKPNLTKDEIFEIGTKDGSFGTLSGKTPDKTLGTQLLRAEKRGLVIRSADRPAKWSLTGKEIPAPVEKPKKVKKASEPAPSEPSTAVATVPSAAIVTKEPAPVVVTEPAPLTASSVTVPATKTWEFDCEEEGTGKKIEHKITVPATMTEDEVTQLHGKDFPSHIAVYWADHKIE